MSPKQNDRVKLEEVQSYESKIIQKHEVKYAYLKKQFIVKIPELD